MTVVVEQMRRAPAMAPPGDETGARCELRRQITRLEGELCVLRGRTPHDELDLGNLVATGPRMLDLGELEHLRDELAARVQRARRELAQRAPLHRANRALLERAYARPERHKGLTLTSTDLGVEGCMRWQVSPHLGPIGRVMGWWRVKVSSGCP